MTRAIAASAVIILLLAIIPAFSEERPQQCPPDKKTQQTICKEQAGVKYEECVNAKVVKKDCDLTKACAGAQSEGKSYLEAMSYCKRDCQSKGGSFWGCHMGCGYWLRNFK